MMEPSDTNLYNYYFPLEFQVARMEEYEPRTIHRFYHYALQMLAKLHNSLDCRYCVLGDSKTAIQQSLVYLYMWAQGLDLRFIETSISKNTRFQETITRELADIVMLVHTFSNGNVSVNEQDSSIAEIDMLVSKYVANSDSDDSSTEISTDDEEDEEDDESDATDTKSSSMAPHQSPLAKTGFPHKAHSELVHRLRTYVRCLMDLLPTLEHHYDEQHHKNFDEEAPSLLTGKDSLAIIHPYIMQVQDKFSLISFSLASRLGEANWARFQRLQDLCQGTDHEDKDSDSQTIAPVSEFQDSGLGASLPSASTYTYSIASHTSMVSTKSTLRLGVARVPPTPVWVQQGAPFNCSICTRLLSNIRNRIDWKLHVFADIRPYVCTVEACTQPRTTFSTRKQWIDHEFTEHRFREIWRCFKCKADYATNAFLLAHIKTAHSDAESVLASDGSIMLDACKKIINDVPKEHCPMCGKCGFSTKHAWSTHVGRHMEEVALVVLPRYVDSDDEDEEDNDSMDDAIDDAVEATEDDPEGQGTHFRPASKRQGPPPPLVIDRSDSRVPEPARVLSPRSAFPPLTPVDRSREKSLRERFAAQSASAVFPAQEPDRDTGAKDAPAVEIFKHFRVALEDPCYKVLPAALSKYNIHADWRNYALYIVYGDQERCVGLEEKPLALFKELDKEGKKPMFMLRKLAQPTEFDPLQEDRDRAGFI